MQSAAQTPPGLHAHQPADGGYDPWRITDRYRTVWNLAPTRNACSGDERLKRLDSEPVRKNPESSIPHLLNLAGVSPSDETATAWLNQAVEGARASYRAASQRRLPADHNDLLADIEKSAKALSTRIGRLRRHPFSWHMFWRSSAFGPVHNNQVEHGEVLSTLENIIGAAAGGRDGRKGRPAKGGEQLVVNLAFAFFVRFSPRTPSGTPTGAFATFARAFYGVVTGAEPEKHGGLDRQIRHAATRLPVELQRARRKSAENPRETS